MNETIRSLLDEVGNLSVPAATLTSNSNLYDAGLTSLATVQVMLALENAFDVEFEDSMLNRKTFTSIAAIESAITQLQSVHS